jgi:hypothetical protein
VKRGYRATEQACVMIEVPAHAYLTTSGDEWKFDRGFERNDQACVTVRVPDHAVFVGDSYGQKWKCNRGFKMKGDRCVQIKHSYQCPSHLFRQRTGVQSSISAAQQWMCHGITNQSGSWRSTYPAGRLENRALNRQFLQRGDRPKIAPHWRRVLPRLDARTGGHPVPAASYGGRRPHARRKLMRYGSPPGILRGVFWC